MSLLVQNKAELSVILLMFLWPVYFMMMAYDLSLMAQTRVKRSQARYAVDLSRLSSYCYLLRVSARDSMVHSVWVNRFRKFQFSVKIIARNFV